MAQYTALQLPRTLQRELRRYHPGVSFLAKEGFNFPLSMKEKEAAVMLVNEVFNDSRFSNAAKQEALEFLRFALRESDDEYDGLTDEEAIAKIEADHTTQLLSMMDKEITDLRQRVDELEDFKAQMIEWSIEMGRDPTLWNSKRSSAVPTKHNSAETLLPEEAHPPVPSSNMIGLSLEAPLLERPLTPPSPSPNPRGFPAKGIPIDTFERIIGQHFTYSGPSTSSKQIPTQRNHSADNEPAADGPRNADETDDSQSSLFGLRAMFSLRGRSTRMRGITSDGSLYSQSSYHSTKRSGAVPKTLSTAFADQPEEPQPARFPSGLMSDECCTSWDCEHNHSDLTPAPKSTRTRLKSLRLRFKKGKGDRRWAELESPPGSRSSDPKTRAMVAELEALSRS